MRKIIITLVLAVAVGTIAMAQNWKLSPMVREAAMMYKARAASQTSLRGDTNSGSSGESKAAAGNARRSITAFVRTSDEGVLQREGCKVLLRSGDICIATIPIDRISALAAMPQIMRIEAGESCSATCDNAALLTGVSDLWDMDQDYSPLAPFTGKGVVVGVMDIGFDLTHPNFYSIDGSRYRIKAFWDHLDNTENGYPVIFNEKEQSVGRQYVGEEALLLKAHSRDGLKLTHGTHTSGTAAGSGAQFLCEEGEDVFCGMAPDADICLVSNYTADDKEFVSDADKGKYTSATDMLGFKYIFDYAQSVGKPCVINFSEGSHDDLYQSGLYGEMLSNMVGPGRILCASAGNEGSGDGTYLHKAIGEDSKSAFIAKSKANAAIYVMKSKEPAMLALDMYQNGSKVATWEYDSENLREYPDSLLADTIVVGNHEMVVMLQVYPSCFDAEDWATDLFVIDSQSTSMGYNIPVKLTVAGRENDIEVIAAGGYFVRSSLEPGLVEYERTHNVLFPGASEAAICVGAAAHTQSRKNIYGNNVGSDYGTGGIRAAFSGIGPANNGMTKPEVMAPGTNIVASYNSYDAVSYVTTSTSTRVIKQTEWNGRTYPWGVLDGTSMATPVVTGIVALWLQACPTLTPDQVKDVIAHTCTKYDGTMTFPNNEYGWGEIDAKAGLDYICEVYTGIKNVSISGQHDIKATYSIDGKKVSGNGHGIFIVNDNGRIRKVVR